MAGGGILGALGAFAGGLTSSLQRYRESEQERLYREELLGIRREENEAQGRYYQERNANDREADYLRFMLQGGIPASYIETPRVQRPEIGQAVRPPTAPFGLAAEAPGPMSSELLLGEPPQFDMPQFTLRPAQMPYEQTPAGRAEQDFRIGQMEDEIEQGRELELIDARAAANARYRDSSASDQRESNRRVEEGKNIATIVIGSGGNLENVSNAIQNQTNLSETEKTAVIAFATQELAKKDRGTSTGLSPEARERARARAQEILNRRPGGG